MTQQWRKIARLERADFYEDWLKASQQNQIWLHDFPVVSRGRDVEWVETVQDHKIGMLIGPQVGFPSSGTNLCKAIIPAGHHTGHHRHGEEAIHIVRGTGFIMVDGRRYDFHDGTTIHVPFHADHQLFNTGPDEVEYISALPMDLDLFVRLGVLEQLAPKGANEPGFEKAFPAEDGQFDAEGRRIALHIEDAPDEQKRRDEIRAAQAAAAARELTPSLVRTLETCRCTVCALSTSCSAISASVCPAATSRRTSVSRLVKDASMARCGATPCGSRPATCSLIAAVTTPTSPSHGKWSWPLSSRNVAPGIRSARSAPSSNGIARSSLRCSTSVGTSPSPPSTSRQSSR
jgi:mannose-6-phosphate isomerase-like protein (cupin superfamily)